MDRFTGQVALVTGSGSGIGRAMAGRLAAEGAAVCVADIDLRSAERTAADIAARGGLARSHHLDVTDQSSVTEVMDWLRQTLGRVDVLVNNAAVADDTPLHELSEEQWDRDVAVALKGAFLCARAVLPDMIDRRDGVILNVGSVNAFQYLGDDPYSAAKAGLVSLTRSLAVRYGPYGIRANMIAPGTIRTPAWDARLARDPELLDRLVRWYPLGRIGTVEDVASAAAFLASRDASWITGTVLTVDGGLLAGNAPIVEDIFGDPAPRITTAPGQCDSRAERAEAAAEF
jgi:NAD(P)-dependent dehydrogenase (short-subunit alcohol dehydrogenase family)